MKINNATESNVQQQELKKRLEEIRRKRLQREQVEENNGEVRQSEKQPQTRKQKRNQKNSRRNRNQQPSRPKRNSQEHQKRNERNSLEPAVEVNKKIKKTQPTIQKQRSQYKKKNSLINQLSNSNNIAQSIVLAEVLSKPVALRKRSW